MEDDGKMATRFVIWVYSNGGDLRELADHYRSVVREIAEELRVKIWGDMPVLPNHHLLVRCIIPTNDEPEAWRRVRRFASRIRSRLKRDIDIHIIK